MAGTRGIRPLLATALLGVACGGEGPLDSGPPDAPRHVALTPGSHAIAAPRDGDLLIRFDRALDPGRIGDVEARAFGRWSGSVSLEPELNADGRTLRLSAERPFAAGEIVTVTLVAGSYRGAEGEPGPGLSWSFWTEASPAGLTLRPDGVLSVRRAGEAPIQTYGAYAGDLDGDGWSDVVVPNERSADLRIFLNDGAGRYGSFDIVSVPEGDDPSTNEGADLDGDGDIDFVVGSARGRFAAVYRGDGAGGLEHVQNLDVGQAVRGVCLLDFENDGDPDLVATAFEADRVALFENDGRGTFVRTGTRDAGAGEWSCAVGDADGDGFADLFIGNRGSEEVVLFLSGGDGTFAVAGRASAGGDPWMLATGDLDGDGRLDAAAVNASDASLAILLGDGRGGLRLAERHAIGGFPLALDAGDLDGDGDLDLVTSNFATARFTLFENTGGAFSAAPDELAAPSAASCAILHDRDNDGDLDLTGIDELEDVLLLFRNDG